MQVVEKLLFGDGVLVVCVYGGNGLVFEFGGYGFFLDGEMGGGEMGVGGVCVCL